MTEELLLRREMGCTREEFLAWLPGATRYAPMRLDADTATVRLARGEVEISFEEAPPRTVGLMSIPVLTVSLRFNGSDAASRDAFIEYFDLHTRRGGG